MDVSVESYGRGPMMLDENIHHPYNVVQISKP